MRQRLGIAQALAGDPAVLLLDEPAAALDPLGRHDVLALLRQLKGDKTVFYSTHILDDVQRVSDHVAILDRGHLVVSAPTADLMRRAAAGTVHVALVGADEFDRRRPVRTRGCHPGQPRPVEPATSGDTTLPSKTGGPRPCSGA